MLPFSPCAHAGHHSWQHAVSHVVAQLRAQISMQKLEARMPLGVAYVSERYAEHARDIIALLSQALPDVRHWVGSAVHAVLAGDTDYGSTGAVAVMLPCVDEQSYQIFSALEFGPVPNFVPHAALIHGDAATLNLTQQISALSQQLCGASLTGGLCDLPTQRAQWSWGGHTLQARPSSIGGAGVQVGGFSGVAFAADIACLAVGMQGCKPVGQACTITQVDGDVVLALDGKPALDVFFGTSRKGDVRAEAHSQAEADGVRKPYRLMAMQPAGTGVGELCLPAQARVMRVVGIDLLRQGIVLDGQPKEGYELLQCQSDEQAMRVDIRRACAELWESLTETLMVQEATEVDTFVPRGHCISGAIYIRSQHRRAQVGSPHVDAELQWIRDALGPVPLLGFTSSCEVNAGQIQHMSAQLLVFTQPL